MCVSLKYAWPINIAELKASLSKGGPSLPTHAWVSNISPTSCQSSKKKKKSYHWAMPLKYLLHQESLLESSTCWTTLSFIIDCQSKGQTWHARAETTPRTFEEDIWEAKIHMSSCFLPVLHVCSDSEYSHQVQSTLHVSKSGKWTLHLTLLNYSLP